jgi:hypothetical protein
MDQLFFKDIIKDFKVCELITLMKCIKDDLNFRRIIENMFDEYLENIIYKD